MREYILAQLLGKARPPQAASRNDVVRPLTYAMVEPAPSLTPHPVLEAVVQAALHAKAWDVVRFLTLELPGGSRWHGLVEAAGRAGDGGGDVSVHESAVRVAVQRQRAWQRRGCLLMLRMLRDTARVREPLALDRGVVQGGGSGAVDGGRVEPSGRTRRQSKRRRTHSSSGRLCE